MKKVTFEKMVGAIIAQVEHEKNMCDSVKNFFGLNEMVDSIAGEFMNDMILAIEEEINDHSSLLSWWLFDAPEAGKNIECSWIRLNNGAKIPLRTIGQLYDYIMGEDNESN